MSTPYEQAGRVEQKRRTRDALVRAAQGLVAAGQIPTIEQAAIGSGISRTTAYRYFPDQRALLRAAHPETAAMSLLPDVPPATVEERLEAVLGSFLQLIRDTEQQQRTMLRLSLTGEPGGLPLRQGRAIGWIAEALEPLRGEIGGQAVHRLALAIRSATGIEALVWLVDVAGLSREEAGDLMAWSAQAMLAAARSTTS
jgi:AcrR family transcriptional regulator